MARAKTKNLEWPPGVVFYKHKRQGAGGELEEVRTPYVRVRYTSADDGEIHSISHQVRDPEHALKVRQKILAKLNAGEAHEITHDRKTFADLADFYEQHYLIPPVFVAERKVAGLRSYVSQRSWLKTLRAYFGRRLLRSITANQLKLFKAEMLARPVAYQYKAQTKEPRRRPPRPPRPRSIATVNRYLSLLRAMFNVAIAEHWLRESPFARTPKLASAADEQQRQRIISLAEEQQLLAAADPERWPYLAALLVLAIDTGMRHGELLQLTPAQLDFEAGIITIPSTHTKTLTERKVKMSQRVKQELQKQIAAQPALMTTERIFKIKRVYPAWAAIREQTGLIGVRWHDLRHTNATRIERSGRVSLAQLGRHLGHANPRTTYRYVNQDDLSMAEIGAVLDEINERNNTLADDAPVN